MILREEIISQYKYQICDTYIETTLKHSGKDILTVVLYFEKKSLDKLKEFYKEVNSLHADIHFTMVTSGDYLAFS